MVLEKDPSLLFFWIFSEHTAQGQNESPAVWEKDVKGSKGWELGGNHAECQTEGKTL